jgi:hypothetical protein
MREHLENGGEDNGGARDSIVIEGMTTCKTLVPVKWRFSYTDGSGGHPLGETGFDYMARLDPPRLPAPVPFTISFPVPKGYPEPPKTFALKGRSYNITAEILRKTGPTGLQIDAIGAIRRTTFPVVIFQPVMLSDEIFDPKGADHDIRMQRIGAEIDARNLRDGGADYLPLKLDAIVALPQPVITMHLKKWFVFRRQSEFAARLITQLQAYGILGNVGRIVVELRDDDFDTLNPFAFSETLFHGSSVVGISIDNKVVIKRGSSGWFSALHELLHTMPYLWSTDQMKETCGSDYHNNADTGVANGVRLYRHGGPVRERMEHREAILGRGDDDDGYIAQCTYAHLTEYLQHVSDPPTLFVRAIVRREGGSEFEPFYTQDGSTDTPAARGTWSFVVRDARGKALRRAPFTPDWDLAALRHHRDVDAIAFRFPLDPMAASVELRSNKGVVLRRSIEGAAPRLALTAPSEVTVAKGTTHLHVAWKASGGRGPLSTSVLYSNGPTTYGVQSFEQPGSSFDVRLDPKAATHRIKVIVTDGARSAQREIRLTQL